MSAGQDAIGIQAMQDVIAVLETWDVNTGGLKPKIESMWEEAMVRYDNTKSYILLQIDNERIEAFSMMEGTAPNYYYEWLHTVNMTLDVRTKESLDRLKQILNQVSDLIKDNVRLSNYIHMIPESVAYDFTVRNIWRATVAIKVLK